MVQKEVQILSSEEIEQKTKRIAYQIVEDNYSEPEVCLIGIKPNGLKYAQKLKQEIEAIKAMQVSLNEISLDKSNPLQEEIKLSADTALLNGKTLILVDDVANTGKTLFYAMKPLMNFSPRKVQTVVLVDRQHKLFPVTPDFVGLSLSTTLKEHIRVQFGKAGESTAYLS